ncbi:NCS1 allantoate transporter [Penicillium cf. griseofulvum]|uniref:NCS1 allantoate transporter n=1 Tax=Penicillium cf. griseofulvum TaxID=2972120 RepID=A0A9W9IWF0_9EURO|nr:NCS1 allantoate transporter [Penicillium cf. griseofulvum]KAJ5430384.1 NCS1 allantoate transporter [Penicillium cf. griseofulvum]KAJ5435846.1 NCS1 allantoate transporter [Penicillium cf. griseofulvum]
MGNLVFAEKTGLSSLDPSVLTPLQARSLGAGERAEISGEIRATVTPQAFQDIMALISSADARLIDAHDSLRDSLRDSFQDSFDNRSPRDQNNGETHQPQNSRAAPNIRRPSTIAMSHLHYRRWALPKKESSIAPQHVWSNADQDPVPPEKWTWTGWTFTQYWLSDLVTISTWSAASSAYASGLSATDTVLLTLVAALCNAIPTVLNGVVGADLHIPFPVAIRASYGSKFGYFCVVSRAILALFWFGIQSAYGGQCVTLIITAIWPSFAKLPNHLPASAAITTQGMVSYLLFHIVQAPFLFIPTHKLQYLFIFKSTLVPPMALAMVIWISVKAGGASGIFHQPPAVHGSERTWLWLMNMTSITGGFSTLAVNISDFSRFSKKPRSTLWQLPTIPLFKVITALFGIIAAGASKQVYGTLLWNPLQIIDKWQGSPGGRAATFFCSALWLLAQICANVSSNSLPFANDLTTMCPKWINIRRGMVVCMILGGWALCPWIIVKSGKTFISFMGAYAIFMAPIAGILCCDYWVIKRRKYDVPALYEPRGIYYYQLGTNWRALVCNLVVVVPLLPGLANAVTPNRVHIGMGLQHLYAINYLYGFCTSLVLYFLLNYFWPDRPTLIPHVVPGVVSPLTAADSDLEADRRVEDRVVYFNKPKEI